MNTPQKQHSITPPGFPIFADQSASGPAIAPIDHLKIISAEKWEQMIAAWAISKASYTDVYRFGGNGDMGYDIAAVRSDDEWDCYQAKRYKTALSVPDCCKEVGKVIYHCFANGLKRPAKYVFAATQGYHKDLIHLLEQPHNLKSEITSSWDKRCRKTITKSDEIPLEGELLDFLEHFDFSVISSTSPDLIIQELCANTSYYQSFFGGPLPNRSLEQTRPPPSPKRTETLYIAKLLEAYVDSGKTDDQGTANLPDDLKRHFIRSRQAFYSTEALRLYARECAPAQFEALLEDFYFGLIDEIEKEFPDGLKRLREVATKAIHVQTSIGLKNRMTNQDRIGMCHHLANDPDRDVTWVRHDH